MMSLVLSAVQIAVPILLGLIVASYLRGVTLRLLVDLCGTEDRAQFWMRAAAVVFVSAPLMFVLVGARNPLECTVLNAACALQVLRQTVMWSLAGVLLAVAAVTRGVGRRIPRQAAAMPAQAAESTS
ncbi:hypothetical protein [Ralstonia sp. UBA689]|uniref:hypothetical protein n=1 Tax=Ralstonia sp. UBA689 TaxID=1947373 RepID=UPI0025FCEE76|nr:hypothetical protein [Ralstonia sp. UBA689]